MSLWRLTLGSLRSSLGTFLSSTQWVISLLSIITMKQKSQDAKTEMSHVPLSRTACKAQCQVLPARLLASASVCFPYVFLQLSIHSFPERENALSLLIISLRTEMKDSWWHWISVPLPYLKHWWTINIPILHRNINIKCHFQAGNFADNLNTASL